MRGGRYELTFLSLHLANGKKDFGRDLGLYAKKKRLLQVTYFAPGHFGVKRTFWL